MRVSQEVDFPETIQTMILTVSVLALRGVEKYWMEREGISLKEGFVKSLNNRFSKESREFFGNSKCLAPRHAQNHPDPEDSLQKLHSLLNFYGAPQTSSYTGKSGKVYSQTSEPLLDRDRCLEQWPFLHDELKVQAECFPGCTLLSVYPKLLEQSVRFPDMLKLVEVVLSWFVGTASVERSFSSLKRVKSRLRSLISPENMECYVMWHINKMEANDQILNEIIDTWYKQKPRNIVL
jgi:hypothetical protein